MLYPLMRRIQRSYSSYSVGIQVFIVVNTRIARVIKEMKHYFQQRNCYGLELLHSRNCEQSQHSTIWIVNWYIMGVYLENYIMCVYLAFLVIKNITRYILGIYKDYRYIIGIYKAFSMIKNITRLILYVNHIIRYIQGVYHASI